MVISQMCRTSFREKNLEQLINCHCYLENKGIHLFFLLLFLSPLDIYLTFTNYFTHSIILPTTVLLINAFNELYSQPHLFLICLHLCFTTFACLSSCLGSLLLLLWSWLLLVLAYSLFLLGDSCLLSLGLPFLALLCPTLLWLLLSSLLFSFLALAEVGCFYISLFHQQPCM